jgi:hypothetical protein
MGVVDLPQGDVEAALTGHQPDRGQIGANLRRHVLSLARLLTRFGCMFPIGSDNGIPGPGAEQVFVKSALNHRQQRQKLSDGQRRQTLVPGARLRLPLQSVPTMLKKA